jgi:GT2 family glycosyltransferase
MSQRVDLSVIIVSHNSADFLKSCLLSLMEQRGVSLQIIVVDNLSTDNTLEMITTQFPQVRLIQRHSAVGFSAANNLGVAQAQAEHLLFLNPDTKLINKFTLKHSLEKYLHTKHLGVLTCRVNLALTHTIDHTCHRGFPTPWASFTHFTGLSRLFPGSQLFGRYYMTHLDLDTEHEIDAAGGMFMLISKSTGQQVGWWDEDYPLYGEDIDLCYRLKQAGYINLYWPAETILHYKGVATGMSHQSRAVSTASSTTTRQVKLWSIEAMEIFYNKHYRHRYPLLVTWLVILGIRLLKFKRIHLS